MASRAPATPVSLGSDRDRIAGWRAEWDAVMARFVPGLANLEAALFAAVEAMHPAGPGRVLDLGGGPGLLVERMARRWPGAAIGLIDIDPVLLALAGVGVPDAVSVIEADLSSAAWSDPAAADGPYDVVTAVMTVHYLHEEQAHALYREVRKMVTPGGLFVVADLMPDHGISSVMDALHPVAAAAAAELAWTRWWRDVADAPSFTSLMRQREALFGARQPAEFTPDMTWHLDAARAAGFAQAGALWRNGRHAAVAALG